MTALLINQQSVVSFATLGGLMMLTCASGVANAADPDHDGVEQNIDNCYYTANSDQLDLNTDTYGDACVHPSAYIHPSSWFDGENTMYGIVNPRYVGIDAHIGAHVWIQNGSVGDYTEVYSDVRLAQSYLGSYNRIGTFVNGLIRSSGSNVIVHSNTAISVFSIGDNAIIGANCTISAEHIGSDVLIRQSVHIVSGAPGTFIGDRVKIFEHTNIAANVRIASDVIIGDASIDENPASGHISIGAQSNIGEGAIIGKGAQIGEGVYIKPYAVVPPFTNIPSWTVFP